VVTNFSVRHADQPQGFSTISVKNRAARNQRIADPTIHGRMEK